MLCVFHQPTSKRHYIETACYSVGTINISNEIGTLRLLALLPASVCEAAFIEYIIVYGLVAPTSAYFRAG